MSDTQKKADLPAALIPKGGIHTGDGWCFRRNPDGTATIMVISPLNGSRIETTLSVEEGAQVQQLCWPVSQKVPVFGPIDVSAENIESIKAQLKELHKELQPAVSPPPGGSDTAGG